MKTHSSVFHLFLRASLVPALVILGAMIALEIGLGLWLRHFSAFCDLSRIIFHAAMVLLSCFLWQPGLRRKSDPGLTLRRLSVSERQVFWWQAAANLVYYLLFWLVQSLLVLCLYGAGMDRVFHNPALFVELAFWPFAHTMVPFRDLWVWISNLLVLLTLALTSAHVPYAQRRKKPLHEAFLALVLFPLSLQHQIHDTASCLLIILVCLLLLAYCLHCVLREEDVYEEA